MKTSARHGSHAHRHRNRTCRRSCCCSSSLCRTSCATASFGTASGLLPLRVACCVACLLCLRTRGGSALLLAWGCVVVPAAVDCRFQIPEIRRFGVQWSSAEREQRVFMKRWACALALTFFIQCSFSAVLRVLLYRETGNDAAHGRGGEWRMEEDRVRSRMPGCTRSEGDTGATTHSAIATRSER